MLDTVVGQEHALKFLRGVLRSERFPKAMVFHGPPGVGKGYAARLFALESCLTGDPHQDEVARKMFEAGDHPELNFYRPEDCYTEAEIARRKTEPTWRVGSIRDILTITREPVIHGKRRTIVFENFERISYGQAAIPDAFLKILEDGVDSTTVILTTTDLDALPGTLRARLTPVRFSRLEPDMVASLLPSRASEEHFELSCRLGRGSIDETLEFLAPEDDDSLSGYQLRERAVQLLKLLHVSSGGKILLYLSKMSVSDLSKFVSVLKSLYADILLLESGVTSGIRHEDRLDDLREIVEVFDGRLARGLPSLRSLDARMNRPGIRLGHQIKSAILDLKIKTSESV